MVTENVNIVFQENGIRVIKARIDELGVAANKATRGIFLLERAFFVLGGAGIARALTSQLDIISNYENRLKLTTTSAKNLQDVQTKLFDVANRSRSSFEGVNEIYNRTALSARELGVSQKELLRFTESVSKASVISGASAREANAALIQLGQGIASNRLGGDELRSILEQLPFVADIIAKQFGVTRGELRQLGTEGKITADQILAAFRNSADEIDAAFKRLSPTIGQSFEVLNTEFLRFLDKFDDATGASEKLANAILFIAANMDKIFVVALSLTAVIGGIFAGKAIGLVAHYISSLKHVQQNLNLTRAATLQYTQASVASAQANVASNTARQAGIARNLTEIAQRKLLLQQEVLSAQFVTKGNTARNIQTGQFVGLTTAKTNLSRVSQQLNIVEGVEVAQRARLTTAIAAQAGATATLTSATGLLGSVQAVASSAMARLGVAAPFVAGAIGLVSKAFIFLFNVIKANPIGIAITALIALQFYYSSAADDAKELVDVQEQLNNKLKEFGETGAISALRAASELSAENTKLAVSIRDVVKAKLEQALADKEKAPLGRFARFGPSSIPSLQEKEDSAQISADAALSQQKLILQQLEFQAVKSREIIAINQELNTATGARLLTLIQQKALTDEEYQKALDILGPLQQQAEILNLKKQYGENSIQVLRSEQQAELDVLAAKLQGFKVSENTRDAIIAQQEAVFALETAIYQVDNAVDILKGNITEIAGYIQPAIDKAFDLLSALGQAIPLIGRISAGISSAAGKLSGLYNKLSNSSLLAKAKNGLGSLFDKALAAKGDLDAFKNSLESNGTGDGGGGGGGEQAKSLQEIITGMNQEIALLKLTTAERKKAQEILKIETELKRSLTAQEKELASSTLSQLEASRIQAEILDGIIGPREKSIQQIAALNVLYQEGRIGLEDYTNAMIKMQTAALQASGTLAGSFKASISSAIMTTSELGSAIGGTFVGFVNSASDALLEFAKTGKLNIKALFAELFANLFKLLANQLLLKIFASVFGIPIAGVGGGGGGGFLAGLIGGATGGSIAATGSGSTDSQLVAFKKRPDERVDILTPGQQQAQQNNMNKGISRSDNSASNNVKIVNVIDPSIIGQFLTAAAGERLIVNIMKKNGAI